MNDYVNKQMNELWINKWTNMWINKRMNKWINHLYEQTNKGTKRKYNCKLLKIEALEQITFCFTLSPV